LDMVWKQSMDSWKPAGQIDGLFERLNVTVKSKAEPAPAAVFARPEHKTDRARMALTESWPGARRRSFFFITLLFPFVWHFALIAGTPFLTKQLGQVMMGKILPFATFVPLVTWIHFSLKRFANLGMSRWWCLAFLAPLLNLWTGYRCFACPAGYAYHKKLDLSGIALAALYWLVVMAAALILALQIGAIRHPVLEKQLRVLIQAAKVGS
jgi:uncharacterized membrane protein YhaH (DUF805 family)